MAPSEQSTASPGTRGLHRSLQRRALAVRRPLEETSAATVSDGENGELPFRETSHHLQLLRRVVLPIWPLKPWLERALPSSLSYVGTVLALLVILVTFIAAVYFATAQVVWAFTQKWEQFASTYQTATSWAEQRGLSLGGQEGFDRLISFGQSLLSSAYTVFVYLAFIALLVMLGLPEVPAVRMKLQDIFDASDRREMIGAIDEIAGKIRRYLSVTTLTSLLTGVASALWAFTVGLGLALVWGVLNFLLNYIPVVGNLVGIIPPSLYALLQFQDWQMPLLVFIGFSIIQIVISNFVYRA